MSLSPRESSASHWHQLEQSRHLFQLLQPTGEGADTREAGCSAQASLPPETTLQPVSRIVGIIGGPTIPLPAQFPSSHRGVAGQPPVRYSQGCEPAPAPTQAPAPGCGRRGLSVSVLVKRGDSAAVSASDARAGGGITSPPSPLPCPREDDRQGPGLLQG